jgi:phage gpG-like protein
MTLDEFARRMQAKASELETFIHRDVPDIVGVEAVNFYKTSFDKQAFAEPGSPKWQDVKRRDPTSPWYGFSYGAPHNFSATRTVADILSGETGELRNAISYRKEPDRVIIVDDKPYAAVHNEGGTAKIFGKTPFRMPKRQFIGPSETLNNNIRDKMERELKRIITT